MPLTQHHETALRGLAKPQFKALMTRLQAAGVVIQPWPRTVEQLVSFCKQPGQPALHPRDVAMPMVRVTDPLEVAVLEQVIGGKITRAPTTAERKKMNDSARMLKRPPRPRTTEYIGATPRRELVVHLLVDKNPHPPAAAVHLRYTHYREGSTVDECVTRGVRMEDVKFHERCGVVKLYTPEAYAHAFK